MLTNFRFFTTLSLLLLLSTGLLSGCSTFNFRDIFDFSGESDELQSAEELAIQAMEEFEVGKYYAAREKFEKIMDTFPFSPQAMLAELKAADCHYYDKEYLEAKVLYQAFEERHPTNEAIPYVMFQIAMCDFRRTDRIDRDISGAEDSIRSFNRLLRAYPDSPYTAEAKARIRAAREFLVNHEYYVAVFYVRTGKPLQAAHRLKYLLAVYPKATIVPKAEKLLQRIEAGDPPKMGVDKWLPDLHMPSWTLFEEEQAEKTGLERSGQ
jgi:outer membrane protein assembly factor BamD